MKAHSTLATVLAMEGENVKVSNEVASANGSTQTESISWGTAT